MANRVVFDWDQLWLCYEVFSESIHGPFFVMIMIIIMKIMIVILMITTMIIMIVGRKRIRIAVMTVKRKAIMKIIVLA